MPDHELSASENAVSIDDGLNVVGVLAPDSYTDNQTRTTEFAPRQLLRWAEAVDEAHGGSVKLVFTPEHPLIATHTGPDNPDVGIGVAPLAPREDHDDDI